MLPRSGGQYIFARHAFGNYAGFLVGWVDWISTCASIGAISLVLGESVGERCDASRASTASPIAMAVVVIFTALLVRGTRLGDLAQRITSLVKAVALLALVVACFVVRRPRARRRGSTGRCICRRRPCSRRSCSPRSP